MKKYALLNLITSMVIFGTIGLFVVNIPLPRGFIAMARGFLGALFLLSLLLLTKRRVSAASVKANLIYLIISGAFIGVNWILLFESYSYTTVSVATLTYYMAPVFVIIISRIALGEKLSLIRCLCIAVAILGMTLISGILETGLTNSTDVIGITLALGAAFLYACVTVLNKKMKNISSYDTSIVQLFVASLCIMPYTLICERIGEGAWSFKSVALLLVVGILHTGVAYACFFSSVMKLEGQTVAVLSFIDPCLSVILAVIFLGDDFTLPSIIGAVLIIGSLIISELFGAKDKE